MRCIHVHVLFARACWIDSEYLLIKKKNICLLEHWIREHVCKCAFCCSTLKCWSDWNTNMAYRLRSWKCWPILGFVVTLQHTAHTSGHLNGTLMVLEQLPVAFELAYWPPSSWLFYVGKLTCTISHVAGSLFWLFWPWKAHVSVGYVLFTVLRQYIAVLNAFLTRCQNVHRPIYWYLFIKALSR